MTRFDWRQFIRVARELGGRAGDEASQRSAISRAYYGVYGLAAGRLIDAGWTAPSGSRHHRVWTAYRTSSSNECRRISVLGFHLRDRRVTADYAATLPHGFDPAREASAVLAVADEAAHLLDRLPADERCFSPVPNDGQG